MVQVGWPVAFATKTGDVVLAYVEKIWRSNDVRPPLLNVREAATGEVLTSVPHKTDVDGATGFYYT